jgi:hypothetical protein
MVAYDNALPCVACVHTEARIRINRGPILSRRPSSEVAHPQGLDRTPPCLLFDSPPPYLLHHSSPDNLHKHLAKFPRNSADPTMEPDPCPCTISFRRCQARHSIRRIFAFTSALCWLNKISSQSGPVYTNLASSGIDQCFPNSRRSTRAFVHLTLA